MRSLPPGPSLPPLVQMLLWIYRPIPFLEQCLRRYGNCFTLRAPGSPPMVFISDPEVVKQVFTGDPDLLYAGQANAFLKPVLGLHSVLVLDGARHLHQRRLMLPSFHGERMQAYGEVMRALTDHSIDGWPIGRPFALQPYMQAVTLDVILRTVLGLDEGTPALAALRTGFQYILALGSRPYLLLLLTADGEVRFRRLQAALGRLSPWGRTEARMREIDRILYAQIARHRGAGPGGRDDVLALLIQARDESGAALSDAELRDEMVTLLMAGHETTATALTFVLNRLIQHPDVLARLRAELEAGRADYLDAVIKETLRLHPIAPVVGRVLQAPLRVGAWECPAGTMLTPCIYLTQRRPDVWPDPERFDPSRFLDGKANPYVFFPFGGGTRRCLGMAFALYEMRIVLGQIVRRVSLRHAPGYRAHTVRRGFTFALSEGLQVVAVERRTAAAAAAAA